MDHDKTTQTASIHQQLNAMRDRIGTFTATPTSRRIEATVKFADGAGAMVAVAGTPGIGKTTTLKRYAAQNGGFYCQFSRDTGSVYATLAEVAYSMDLTVLPTRPDDLRRMICNRVDSRSGVLICDEAQHLSPAGFETIRTLHDRTGVAVVLAGHLDLMDRLKRLPQLDGRISAPLTIGSATPADADALFDAWGFEDRRARDFLRQYAGQRTGLRRIAKTFELALLTAARDGVPVGFDHVRTAWTTLSGSVSTAA